MNWWAARRDGRRWCQTGSMVVIAVVFPLLLLFAAVLVELAARGRLRRNWIAGIRTRATMRSDATWVAGHQAAARTVWIGFVLSSAAGVVALVTSGSLSVVFAVIVVIVLAATVTVALVQSGRASAAVVSP